MIPSANSMKLGILRIDSDQVIFQKSAIRILNYRSSLLCSGLSGFSLSSIFWLILGGLSSMQYNWNSIAKLCHQSVLFEDLYSRKCRRCLYSDYCSVDLRALPIVLHILIDIIPILVPFVFILPLSLIHI